MSSACCHKDKGWKPVELFIGENESTIPTEGLYQIRVINQGDVTLKVGTMRVEPGNCIPMGIDWLPCATAMDCEWIESETGQRKALVTAVKIVEYYCEK